MKVPLEIINLFDAHHKVNVSKSKCARPTLACAEVCVCVRNV